ncbi:MAG: HmuY family protein [Candidatus Kapaibacterium sp.]
MKTLSITFLFCATIILNSCSDDTVTPNNNTTDLGFVIKTNISAKPADGWVYYSFDKDTLIDPSKADGADWDVKFRYIPYDTTIAGVGPLTAIFTQSGPMFFNSGTVNKNGQTQVVLVDDVYDNVTDATKYTLRNDDTTTTGRVVPIGLGGSTALFIYSGAPNHVLTINPSKTFVIKTKSNKYVKMALTSIYKDAPLSPKYNTNFANYFTIKYTHADGTRLK